jgi:hypothetical protein
MRSPSIDTAVDLQIDVVAVAAGLQGSRKPRDLAADINHGGRIEIDLKINR